MFTLQVLQVTVVYLHFKSVHLSPAIEECLGVKSVYL